MAWLNLTMPNQTVKNSLKAKKIKFPQMNFLLEKPLIKCSCTYWLLSHCKIFKKFLGPIQSYEDVPFLGPKWPICPEQFFFGTNHCYYFHLPISPFHCAKLKKILTADPELWRCAIFGPKMVHLPRTKFFLENYYYYSHLPISPFENFFRKPVIEPWFFHSCLSTCQNQSQILIY